MTFPNLPNQSQAGLERPREPTAQELWLGPKSPSTGRRPWLWIGLGVGAGALVLAAAAAVLLALVVFSPAAGVKRASEQMSADLAAGNLTAAYGAFTPALRERLSEASLRAELAELQIDSSCAADIQTTEATSGTGQRPAGNARGVLVCGSRAFDLSYRWQGDPLTLDGIKVQPR